MAARYVLTLVHGTWGSTKGWVAAGSLMRRELERRLASAHQSGDDASVTFREFAWSGANTHADRMEAGARLAQVIRDGHAQHPEARHFVIAHSHGGNVALYATRDPSARHALSGIVTLGTPFLYVRSRRVERHADIIAWLLLGALAMVPFLALDALGVPRIGLGWLIAAMALMWMTKPRLAPWLVEIAALEQAAIETAVQPPVVEASKLAILCTSGDEARRWLLTWDTLARAPFIVGCILLSVMEVAARSNLPALIEGVAQRTIERGLDDIHVFGVDGLALVIAGSLVLCFVWGAVLMASGIVRWPGYPRDSLLTNLLVEVGTDRVPRAAGVTAHGAVIFDIPAPTDSRRLRARLRHTAICRNQAVIDAITEWITSRPPIPRVAPFRRDSGINQFENG